MSQINVRIVKLEPIRVASAYGFGPSPEMLAHKSMVGFLTEQGLLDGYGTIYRHFGFNNPSPSLGSPNYGYEIWVNVPDDIQPAGDIRIQHFGGGLYAVTRFKNLEKITPTWEALVHWRERSPYQPATHQWLENLINPLEPDPSKYIFELYLPVAQ
jgi:DNA gyrase inhibitor GyrI